MNYRDFEKYNGMFLSDIVEVTKKGYITDDGTIDGIPVKVFYEEDDPYADVRLMDNRLLIGHAVSDENNNYVFEASDHEWT